MAYAIRDKEDGKFYAGEYLYQSMVGDMERWAEWFPKFDNYWKPFQTREEAQSEIDNNLRYYSGDDCLEVIEVE